MLSSPFLSLQQFSDWLEVVFLAKADRVRTDEKIATALGVDRIASLWQMHGNRTIVVRSPTSRSEQADGIATDESGLTLTSRSADCQSFVLVAPKERVICLLHAGWRGMKAKAITAAYGVLSSEWRIDPKTTWVGVGPSLCRTCAEFSDPKSELPELSAFITGTTVDLQAAADAELWTLGIPPNHIDRPFGCTKCQPKQFWTYRGGDREAVKEGWTNCLACRVKDGRG